MGPGDRRRGALLALESADDDDELLEELLEDDERRCLAGKPPLPKLRPGDCDMGASRSGGALTASLLVAPYRSNVQGWQGTESGRARSP